jgi:hypothetical protein
MGVISGKLGNMVGQKNTLVSNKDKQVWRVYQGNVANPKTIKQAYQRSLFVAAKNFKVALSKILDHSWQGVQYGTKSLNHFEKMVLANGGANFPNFILQARGSQDAIPQPFPVSRGSIPFDSKLTIQDVGEIEVNGIVGISGTVPATVGEVWQAILALNPQLKDGDMITIVAFISSDDHTPAAFESLYPVYDRFIINVNDTNAYVSDQGIASQKGVFAFEAEAQYNNHPIVTFDDVFCAACTIIISRQKGNKAQWQRSNADMNVDSGYMNWMMSTEYINACLDSFMASAASADSDWYLDQTGETTPTSEATGIVETKTATLSDSSTTPCAYYKYNGVEGFIYVPADQSLSGKAQKCVLSGNTISTVDLADGISIVSTPRVALNDVFNKLVEKGYYVIS